VLTLIEASAEAAEALIDALELEAEASKFRHSLQFTSMFTAISQATKKAFPKRFTTLLKMNSTPAHKKEKTKMASKLQQKNQNKVCLEKF